MKGNNEETPAAGASARKSQYHHGNLRQAVIDEAGKLLEEVGAQELSLRLISRKLGVSQQAPFHHFQDKNALLATLATEGFQWSATALRARPVKDPTLEARVSRLCSGYLRMAQGAPQLFRLMFGTQLIHKGDYPQLVAAATASFEALRDNVEDMLRDFGIRHVKAELATVAIWSLNHGLASLIIDGQISPMVAAIMGDQKGIIEQVTRLFVHGLESASAF